MTKISFFNLLENIKIFIPECYKSRLYQASLNNPLGGQNYQIFQFVEKTLTHHKPASQLGVSFHLLYKACVSKFYVSVCVCACIWMNKAVISVCLFVQPQLTNPWTDLPQTLIWGTREINGNVPCF